MITANIIKWVDYDKFYGLDYSTKLGKFKDYTFDIRYDSCGDLKIKPEKCGLVLTIYFKNKQIESDLGNMTGLINYSERYIQNEITNWRNALVKTER